MTTSIDHGKDGARFVSNFNWYAGEMGKMFPKHDSEIQRLRSHTIQLYAFGTEDRNQVVKSFQTKAIKLVGAQGFDFFQGYVSKMRTNRINAAEEGKGNAAKRTADEIISHTVIRVEVPDLTSTFGVTVKRYNKVFKVIHSMVPKILVGDIVTHLNDIRVPETTDSTVFAAWLNSIQGKFTISVERPTALVLNEDIVLLSTKRVVYSVGHASAVSKRCVVRSESAMQKTEVAETLLSLSAGKRV